MSYISSVGFIGGRKYAQYVAQALLSAGTVRANQVAASSRTEPGGLECVMQQLSDDLIHLDR